MASFNKVMLIGNLTRDPVLKYLPSGTAVVELGLACNRKWKDRESGQQREVTTFVDCKTMGRPAEIINQYMSKGRPIFIEGRLDYRSWEAQDGTKRSKLEVFIENFQFLGGAGEGRGGQGGGGGGYGERSDPPQRQADPGSQMSAGGDYVAPGAMGTDDDVPF